MVDLLKPALLSPSSSFRSSTTRAATSCSGMSFARILHRFRMVSRFSSTPTLPLDVSIVFELQDLGGFVAYLIMRGDGFTIDLFTVFDAG